MLESQRLTQERLKLATEINALGNEIEERLAEDPKADVGELTGKRNALLDQHKEKSEAEVAALEKEDREAQEAVANQMDTDGWTAERREFRDLAQRVTIADYVHATAENHGEVRGAAKEYNEHVFGSYSPGDYPLEMLLDRDEIVDMDGWQMAQLKKEEESQEERTILSVTNANQAGRPSFVDRLLASSDGAYVGASYPAVGPGRHSYPIISGTTVAAALARDADETPAGTLSIVNADPERIQHSYEYAVVDEIQLPGIAANLAGDLRMSLMSGLDNKVIDDLLTALTDPSTTTTVITLAATLGKFGAAVDGRGARDVRAVRMLVGTETYATVSALSISNIGHFFQLMPHDRFRASSHIAAASSQNQAAIVYRTGAGNLRRLVVPVWRRGQLLRSQASTEQRKGNVLLTGVMYADVILVNSDLHKEETFHLS